MLSVIIKALYAECHYVECRYSECRYAECHGAKHLYEEHNCIYKILLKVKAILHNYIILYFQKNVLSTFLELPFISLFCIT